MTPCSILFLVFVNLMWTKAAGAAEMNNDTAMATGKSTQVCRAVKIGSSVNPMKLVSNRNTTMDITSRYTEDFVGTHIHQRRFGLHAMS